MLWAWIAEGDGFVILLCLWLVLVTVFNIVYVGRMGIRVNRCEFKLQGFTEKIMDANYRSTQVGQELRRITGSFEQIVDEELANAATRIRDRITPTPTEDESK